jgi:hypothetical protein
MNLGNTERRSRNIRRALVEAKVVLVVVLVLEVVGQLPEELNNHESAQMDTNRPS